MSWTMFALFLSLTTSAAAGDVRSPEELSKDGDRALALARDGKLDEAVVIWKDILDELPKKGRLDVHVNLAVAYESLGLLPEAWHHLDANLRGSESKDPAVEGERARIERLLTETHVPLRFSCIADGTTIYLDAAKTQGYPCPLRWWFKRGTEGHVHATAPGRKPGTTPIRAHMVDIDRRLVVTLEPIPVVPVKPDPDVGTGTVVSKPADRPTGLAWKWSLLGGGVGLVATAAILQVVAYNKDQDLQEKFDPTQITNKTDFENNTKDYNAAFASDVKPLAYSAYALYGVGAAAAAAGLTFLISDWSRPAAPASVQLAPLVSPDVFGMTIDLGF